MALAAGAKGVCAGDAATCEGEQLAAAYSEKVSRFVGGNERFEFGRHKGFRQRRAFPMQAQ